MTPEHTNTRIHDREPRVKAMDSFQWCPGRGPNRCPAPPAGPGRGLVLPPSLSSGPGPRCRPPHTLLLSEPGEWLRSHMCEAQAVRQGGYWGDGTLLSKRGTSMPRLITNGRGCPAQLGNWRSRWGAGSRRESSFLLQPPVPLEVGSSELGCPQPPTLRLRRAGRS